MIPRRPDFVHHDEHLEENGGFLRELVFGMEDGMVSTLGSITGIAAATNSPQIVILSGLVIVAVESISMAVGSYLSSKSVLDLRKRKLTEEKYEIGKYPDEEKKELEAFYVSDGWSKDLAKAMSEEASGNSDLFLREMAIRELNIAVRDDGDSPLKNGATMLFAYILGGFIPLSSFIFFGASSVLWAIAITLIGLFALGAYTTKFSRRSVFKAGFEMVALASAAAFVGFLVGRLAEMYIV